MTNENGKPLGEQVPRGSHDWLTGYAGSIHPIELYGITPGHRGSRARGPQPRKVTARVLDHFYRAPDPFETLEEYRRFTHADLHDMSLDELHREIRRVRYRLDYDDAAPPWFAERIRLVHAMLTSYREVAVHEQTAAVKTRSALRTIDASEVPTWR